MKIDNVNLNLLNKNLDGLWLRQQVTMDNIANYSTPGYKSKFVEFKSVLKTTLENSSDSADMIIKENNEQSLRLDGNNVDIEKENLNLSKTQLEYMYTVSEINSYFRKLKSAISEGKK